MVKRIIIKENFMIVSYDSDKRIEVSEEIYWKRMKYHDALLYCSMMVIDAKDNWRMIKDRDEEDRIWCEYIKNGMFPKMYESHWIWREDVNVRMKENNTCLIVPVRDI